MIKQPPAYHLRLNKAVDRYLLIELLKKLDQQLPTPFTKQCLYCGFGGPYLEDIRLIHENFPAVELHSIEKCSRVYERQKFHTPCNKVKLHKGEYSDFLRDSLSREDANIVCWLDYTELTPSVISEFTETINTLGNTAIVRITVPAKYKDHKKCKKREPSDNFRIDFGNFLPPAEDIENAFHCDEGFVQLLSYIFKIAAQRTVPKPSGRYFIPVSSSYYSDSTVMFSLTGIVFVSENSEDTTEETLIEYLRNWEYANELQKKPPQEINLPFLTTKERLRLQHLLPDESEDIGKKLYDELGYNISASGDDNQAISLLKMYARFYRYYPYFIRGNP